MKSHARIVRVAMLFNLVLWAWFWVDLGRHTTDYTDRTPTFEEMVPVYKFGARALPPEAEGNLMSFRTMLLFQRPTFFAVGQAANILTSRPWDQRIGGLSIGAYVLIAATLISFAQWAAFALLLAWVVRLVTGGQPRPIHRPV
ncbi:MAG TPA: hypothetical protein VFQ91_21830 [Bryobacteraceae bacterium]|nr:hypothetical protein [Bryobacteraceae bacterium]